jgi:hypothetical protein
MLRLALVVVNLSMQARRLWIVKYTLCVQVGRCTWVLRVFAKLIAIWSMILPLYYILGLINNITVSSKLTYASFQYRTYTPCCYICICISCSIVRKQ